MNHGEPLVEWQSLGSGRFARAIARVNAIMPRLSRVDDMPTERWEMLCLNPPYGYGSIPIDTFLVGWTSIYQLFWGSLGTRVLTHPHILERGKEGNGDTTSYFRVIFNGIFDEECDGNGLVSKWHQPHLHCRDFNMEQKCKISTMWWNGVPYFQWEFQDPKMEVLYHIRPYFVGIFPYIGLI